MVLGRDGETAESRDQRGHSDAHHDHPDQDVDEREAFLVVKSHECTCRKMPYMAETSAIATKPTTSPTPMRTAGSKRSVNRFSL